MYSLINNICDVSASLTIDSETDFSPFIVNGIAYEITSDKTKGTVKVIANIENRYLGSITILSTIRYN
jgi:hypothetical protein